MLRRLFASRGIGPSMAAEMKIVVSWSQRNMLLGLPDGWRLCAAP
jgi:hypothetical protein